MVKSRWEQYKEKNGSTPLDLINPRTRYVGEDISEVRMNVCRSCEHFFAPTTQCKQCGCFMAVKTKIEISKCPLEKW